MALDPRAASLSPAPKDLRFRTEGFIVTNLRTGLDDVEKFVRRFCVLPSEDAYATVALWTVLSHTMTDDWPHVAPYLGIGSPLARCGKSRVLDALEPLVKSAWRVDAAPTAAILFRKLEDGLVTMLLDEIDQVFTRGSENGELIGVLNAGWRRGAVVAKTSLETHKVKEFSAFAPKVIAGIDPSKWPTTITDRSVMIELARKRPSDVVERWKQKRHFSEGEVIRERLELLEPLGEKIAGVQIADILEIDDRAFDAWEPLLQIAAVAKGDWPTRAEHAAIHLSAARAEDDQIGVQLLRDVRIAIGANKSLGSAEMVDALRAMPESPWLTIHDGRGLNANSLGRLLRPFGIASRSIRAGDKTAKGYFAAEIRAAVEAYLPSFDFGGE